jgi:Fuc2NAc and GlcNAc transferase
VTPSFISILCGASFLSSLVACHTLRLIALRYALLDQPNERSLHTVPVPRLGGIGILAGTACASAVAIAFAPAEGRQLALWLAAAFPLAGLGLGDDLRGLGAGFRFLVQGLVAVGFAVAIGVPTRVVLVPGMSVAMPYWLALAAWTVFSVGVLNIYNFMDGMDGLAALQAIGAALAVAVGLGTGSGSLSIIPLTLGAATAGFFIHNAPPAKIFMGDAGSTFVGFTFAGLALCGASRPTPLPIIVVPVALAPFLLDGTYTIARRLARHEKIWSAHRSHLYQRAVAAGLSHHDVLVRYAGWIACSTVASILVANHGGLVALMSVAIALSGFALVGLWVHRLESSGARRAPQ